MNPCLKYVCGHCGKPNPEFIAHRGESNCCKKCLKDLHYRVYYKDTGYYITILLTKKSALQYWNSQKDKDNLIIRKVRDK